MLFCRNLRMDGGGVLIATCAQNATEDEIAVHVAGKRVSVTQLPPSGAVTRAEQTSFGFPKGTYAVEAFSPQRFTVELNELTPRDRVVYFSGGKLQALSWETLGGPTPSPSMAQ